MTRKTTPTFLSKSGAVKATVAGLAIASASLAFAHSSKDEPMQAYRQSYFALVAMNFGPIGAMLKGDMPWDDAQLKAFADNVAGMATVDVARAFGPGSDKGMTRAKPEIWENTDDFLSKYDDFKSAAAGLATAAATGDKAVIGEAFKKTGGTCKSCHDEYKAKDYLY
ncbi:MAG: cytochrome c [Halieaceae bacterium]|nr:cytochrome c [Halieaceae bacterium]